MPRAVPGQRFGGRAKGTPNKRTPALKKARDAALKEALTGGESPLDIIIHVMRETGEITDRQFAAACAAAPYVHARLSSATVVHKDAFSDLTVVELRALIVSTGGFDATDDQCEGAIGTGPLIGGTLN
jgi:hypothetical protein